MSMCNIYISEKKLYIHNYLYIYICNNNNLIYFKNIKSINWRFFDY